MEESWLPRFMRHLVFTGGGVRGVAYIGILEMLECVYGRKAMQSGVRACAGCSIGALIALMVVLGCDAQDVRAELDKTDLANMLDYSVQTVAAALSGRSFSFGRRCRVEQRLRQLLRDHGHDEHITLAQLYAATGRWFVVSVDNVSLNRNERWDHRNHPTMPVWLALATSMAVPGLMEPTELVVDDVSCLFVDGGSLGNVPCGSFPPAETLVLRVFGHQARLTTPFQFAIRCLFLAANQLERQALAAVPAAHLISVDCTDVSSLSLSAATPQLYAQLIGRGRSAVFLHLCLHASLEFIRCRVQLSPAPLNNAPAGVPASRPNEGMAIEGADGAGAGARYTGIGPPPSTPIRAGATGAEEVPAITPHNELSRHAQ